MKHVNAILCILITLIMVVPDVLVSPAAAQSGPDAPAVGPSSPTVDHARKQITELVGATIATMDATLAHNNVSVPSQTPVTASTVFHDDVEGRMLGGIGEWRPGAEWRVAPGAGVDGSKGWTITNASGKYATMDSVLLSPAIDLSAYLPGSLPAASSGALNVDLATNIYGACSVAAAAGYGTPAGPEIAGQVSASQAQRECTNLSQASNVALTFERECTTTASAEDTSVAPPDPTLCASVAQKLPGAALLQKAIILSFQQRYQFGPGDGAQILVFTQDPRTHPGAGLVVEPMQGYGQYSQGDVRSLADRGFVGESSWELVAFDLTYWASATVWLGFRVATSSSAQKNPSYFRSFDPAVPAGWAIDNVEITAPAYGSDSKLFSLKGPDFREDAGTHHVQVAPGSPVVVNATIVHASSSTQDLRVAVTVGGLDNGTFSFAQDRQARPGEVWVVPISFNATTTNGSDITISARVLALGSGGTSAPDPTANNQASTTIVAQAVPRFSVAFAPSSLIADDGASVTATVTVNATGNVPVDVRLTLNESYVFNGNETGYVAHPDQTLRATPGSNGTATWMIDTLHRGPHTLNLTASMPGKDTVNLTPAHIHVHSSPPPIFAQTGPGHDPNWTTSLATMPIPLDNGSMWVARFPGPRATTLIGTPNKTAAAASTSWTDLQLTMRYLAVGGQSRVEIAYVNPTGNAPNSAQDTALVAWSKAQVGNGALIDRDQNLTWHTIHEAIQPNGNIPYVDAWSLQGLQVRALGDGSGPSLHYGFFIDELKLTGVPVGMDESYRTDLVDVTGDSGDDGAAALPEQCNPYPNLYMNCWTRMNASDAVDFSSDVIRSHWKDSIDGQAPMMGDQPALWSYVATSSDSTVSDLSGFNFARDSDRLTTPILHLREATEPVLTFDHQYHFPGLPLDGDLGDLGPPTYAISQLGYVELQYLQDDGSWSQFYPLVPDGAGGSYPLPAMAYTPEDPPRVRHPWYGSYGVGEGYFYPSPCEVTSHVCISPDRFIDNYYDDAGTHVLVDYPGKAPESASFHLARQPTLAGVDLANRDVRVGFRVAQFEGSVGRQTPSAQWAISNLRVTPVERFAIDGALDAIRLDVPYDWQRLGVGPGTVVPINATIRNAGLYAVPFNVSLSVRALHGSEVVEPQNFSLGILQPGENRSVDLSWLVPAGEGERTYEVVATLSPDAQIVKDENAVNDALVLGGDGSLIAHARQDLAMDASVSPTLGRPGLPRYVSVVLHNAGNIPLDGIRVTRTVEQLENGARVTRDATTFNVPGELPADPRGVRLEELTPRTGTREFEISDGFFTPAEPGDYIVTVTATSSVPDADPTNNFFTGGLTARASLYADDFDGKLDWTPDASGVWLKDAGFRSAGSLAATNLSSGVLPRDLDATVTSPPIRLSNAESATVNLFSKYDLEESYDGARLEVSTDGAHWASLPPSSHGVVAGKYPSQLVGSNPIAQADGADGETRAISGDSRKQLVQLDGWVPQSFDLTSVPGITEDVPFKVIDAPAPKADEETYASLEMPYSYYRSSMITDPSKPGGSWLVSNLSESYHARGGLMWWSGFANPGGGHTESKLEREFHLDEAHAGATLTLSWWEMRAGTLGSDWHGTDGIYSVQVLQPDDFDTPTNIADASWFHAIERDGPWTHVKGTLHGVNVSRSLTIAFDLVSYLATGDDQGWAIQNVDLRATRVVDGEAQLVGPPLTLSDEQDLSEWGTWSRVPAVPPSGVGWASQVAKDPDGLPRPQWRIDVPTSDRRALDSRLVTPVIDLTDLGSSRASLRLTHKYDLNENEGSVAPGDPTWTNQAFQGGVVEIQAFNETRGAWDDWRQLFASSAPQASRSTLRPTSRATTDGSPYTVTLPDSGDTFQRFPRTYYQTVGSDYLAYLDPHPTNLSYAFGGVSPADDVVGFAIDAFDLSPYVGEHVRFGFHAWASPVDPSNKPHYWQIGRIEVIGTVLSSPDIQLRLRVATDGSVLDGNMAIDQLEVSGVAYTRSVGIAVDSKPTAVAPAGFFTVAGEARNYGDDARAGLGIGLLNDRFASVVVDGAQAAVPRTSRYAAVVKLPSLASAGTPGASAPFKIRIGPGLATGQHRVAIEVVQAKLQADGTVDWLPAPDDVPGRARRDWQVDIVANESYRFENVSLDPEYLGGPGTVHVRGTLRSLGTNDEAPIVDPEITLPNGTIQPVPPLQLDSLPPFQTEPFALDVPFARPGDYHLGLSLEGTTHVQPWSTIVRVGTKDLSYQTSFPIGGDTGAWNMTGARITDDEALFGNTSLLFGLNNSEHFGEGLDAAAIDSVRTSSAQTPPIDLSAAQSDAVLEFWEMPQLGPAGTVTLSAVIPGTACTTQLLPPFRGAETSWTFVQVPLHGVMCGGRPLMGGDVAFNFSGNNIDVQGWRLDGLTITSGATTISPSATDFPLADSGEKVFPILVRNEGRAPRTYALDVDAAMSKLSIQQQGWIEIIPSQLLVGPGDVGRAEVHVRPPTARGAFPQSLAIAVRATPIEEPFTRAESTLAFAFAPLPRQDIAVALSVDGAGAADGVGIEEGVPHEIAASITNEGPLPSRPTTIVLTILDDRTGSEVWRRTESLPGLAPFNVGESSEIASGSWTPEFGHRGNFTLHAVVDPYHDQIDYDRSNDDVALPVKVTRLMRPDLVVDPKSVRITTPDGRVLHEAKPGELIRLSATVRNDGLVAAHDATFRVFAGRAVLKQELLGSLEPDAIATISATQFAPSTTTNYAIQVSTADLQLSTSNDQQTVVLPVFPPDLNLTSDEANITFRPGVPTSLSVRVRDESPYPTLVDLETDGTLSNVALSASRIALSPGESRDLVIEVKPRTTEAAGPGSLVLRARSSTGEIGQLTLDYEVLASPNVDAVVFAAGGPPGAILVTLDAANLGNVPLSGVARLVDADGQEAGQVELPAIPPGSVGAVKISAALAKDAPPGSRNMTIRFDQDGTPFGSVPVEVTVNPWSSAQLDVTPTSAGNGTFRYDVTMRYDGNVPSLRQPRIFGLPEGSRASFEPTEVLMHPGETRRLTASVRVPAGIPAGLYEAEALAIDPASPIENDTLVNTMRVVLDLRAPRLNILSVTRAPGTPAPGMPLTWLVKVRNDGDAPAEGTPLELYVNGILTSVSPLDLQPTRSREILLSFSPRSGTHAIVIAVDAHGPHRGDTPAFGESIHVPASFIEGASTHALPAPSAALLILAVAGFAIVLRRRPPRAP